MGVTSRNITTNVVLNGVNNMSGPLGRGIDQTTSKLDALGNRMRMISYGAFNIGRTFLVGAAGIASPIVYATKKAIDFEDQMTNVAKVADIEFGSSTFKKVSEEAKDLSKYLGVSAVDAGKLFQVLSQSGTETKDLAEIAKIAGRVGVAFDIEAETAGKAFGFIKNILQLTAKETSYVADAINLLDNTSPAEAGQILTFLSSGGAALARAYKISGQEMAAFGSTLITNGKSGEEAATIMERMTKWINKSATAQSAFSKAGGGVAGLLAVLNKGLKSKDPEKYWANFGDYRNDIRGLALSMTDSKGLLNALEMVNDRTRTLGSAQREFEAKQKSTLSLLKREWAGFNATMIDVGNQALPVVRDLVGWLKPMAAGVGAWVKENPRATASILKLTTGLAGLSLAVGVGSYLVGGLATVWRAYAAIAGYLVKTGVLTKLTTAFNTMTIAGGLTAGPILLVGGALASLGYLAYKTYEDLYYIPKMITKIYYGSKALLRNILPALGALLHGNFDKAYSIGVRADWEKEQDFNSLWNDEERRVSVDQRRKRRGYGPLMNDPVKPATPIASRMNMFQSRSSLNAPRPQPAATITNPFTGQPGSAISVPMYSDKEIQRMKMPTDMQPIKTSSDSSQVFQFSPVMNFNGGTPGAEVQRMIDEANQRGLKEFERTMQQVMGEQQRRNIRK